MALGACLTESIARVSHSAAPSLNAPDNVFHFIDIWLAIWQSEDTHQGFSGVLLEYFEYFLL
jgi:hypothetical protein